MPAATPSLLEALFTARLDLNERAHEIRGRADLERERVDAAIDTERTRILGYQATHPAAPVAGDLDADEAVRSADALRDAAASVDDCPLRELRAELDELVQHARVLERAIVDHLTHAGISDPIAVAAALLAHRGDPYPLERDLLEFMPAAR